MPSTQSAQGQLLAGLEHALLAPLSGGLASALATTDGLRYAWPAEDLVQMVRDGTLSVFPFIVISLGKEQVDPTQGTATAFGGAGTVTGPTGPAQQGSLATRLIETNRWQCPLTLMIVAGGNNGMAVADRIRTLVKVALRNAAASVAGVRAQTTPTPALILPLPDDLETAATVPGPLYNLRARLDDLGALPVMNDAARLLYRLDLQYRAHYSEYRPEVTTIAQGVTPTYDAGIFQHISIPATS